jgi:hypothetical protein
METGGISGATIELMVLDNLPLGSETIGGLCTAGLRLPPGGVLDTFYTDEGYRSLSYCAPYGGLNGTPTLDRPVDLEVYFADDDGRRGRVNAKVVQR